MQKKRYSDKANTGRSSRTMQTRGPQSRNPMDSVKELLQRSTPVLAGLQREAVRQRDWLQWVKRELPEELACRVTGVTEQSGELVIFAESAVWGVRIRYAAPQLLNALGLGQGSQEGQGMGGARQAIIVGVKVRVVPRG